MSEDVYIVGIDMTPFGRYPNRTTAQLGAEAALLALDDAGLTIQDMQALYCGNQLQAFMMIGQQILHEIGETGIPVVNTANACASGGTAFREGYFAVKGGMYDLVLAVGVEQMGRGLLGAAGRGDGFIEEGVIGSMTTPAMFSQIGMEHHRKYGTTFEQFAKIAVKNHHHSTFNPKAMSRRETPLEEVMASEMISYPNTKLMCSINVDGAAAAIIASEKKVKELGLMGRAIRVRASQMTSTPFTPRQDAITDFNLTTRNAANAAYEQAGVGPQDVQLIELHDCFATAEMVHYENLGICGEGEAGMMVDTGATAMGGRIPVNLSGGLLSKGHPLGATGIANLYEISLHLRGEAGARQVENAKIGLTHVVGGMTGLGTACVVHVLEKA
ncbi:thiolase family protein [Sphingomonas canadensis]|uniref:propanoyl-CoA C-acyltransferase n=1 Tax=Sphingomonas canadensis TaxID=1219257 RepID=A0ABW3H4M3_9SPHN|nr:thiolase family protein [Sphingomonas canadensis]MCW3834480.1 thiolase family protein [Sphingomonas canadensis]